MSEESLQGVEAVETVEATEEPSKPTEDVKEEVAEDTETKAEAVEEKESQQEDKPLTKAQQLEAKIEANKAQFEKRLSRKTAATKAQAEKIEALEKQISELSANTVQTDDSPKEDDYNTFEEWQEAVVEYKAEKKVSERLLAQKQEEKLKEETRQRQEQAKAFELKEHEFRSTTPDYDDKQGVFNELAADLIRQRGAENPTLSSMSQVILDSDMSPALVYHLGSNPDMAEEIADMTPIRAAKELWKLEMSLGKSEPLEEKRMPAPAKSLNGTGRANKSIDNMSAGDLMKWVKS